MSKMFLKLSLGMLAIVGLMPSVSAAPLETKKSLHGHVPAVVSQLTPLSRVNATNRLRLAIGLPVRNPDSLNNLLQQIIDPASSNFRHYLTPQQFTEQFGPTEQDYQAVIEFAKTNGLKLVQKHDNRMLVEVEGRAADVERAFNITLRNYKHPTENRNFFAPDTEPSVPATLPVLDVEGVSSFVRPHPRLHLNANAGKKISGAAKAGSAPDGSGSYFGYDFRAAYVPGTTLTGAGQKIALFQADGYLASDIALYEQQAGLPSVSLTNILLQGFSGNPTGSGGEVEVSLDIEMCISMAPGISQILLYEGDINNYQPNVILNRIAADNAARQVSSSWGWSGGPSGTTDQIFQEMILQGQTFFDASGDVDAFLPPGTPGSVDDPNTYNAPSDCPYIIQVGGTTLNTTGPGGSWVAETVWNWGGGTGSSGGISGYYPIANTAPWQQGFATAANHGSTTFRNIPDVALTGDNVFVIADNGVQYPGTGGTSCAAPLWAGFTALINQQAALSGKSAVGFLNPALYALAKTAAYTNVFNDITTGNNFWYQSRTNFPAVAGYDLCTGLGTPKGMSLITALVSQGSSAPITISAPAHPWGTNLAAMNGSNPNGDWFLFVQDDVTPDSGIINNGWSVSLTTAYTVGTAADNQLYVTATNNLAAVLPGANFTLNLAVTNYGPSSSANVFVTDTLPATNLTLLTSIPTNGVSLLGPTLVWNIGNLAKDNGAGLTLTFNAAATGLYTNTANVSAITSDPNPDDDTVTTLINVAPASQPQLSGVQLVGGAAGGLQMTVANTPGQSEIVQATTNLVAPNWLPIYTNPNPAGTFVFTNFDYTNFPMRFYRVVNGP